MYSMPARKAEGLAQLRVRILERILWFLLVPGWLAVLSATWDEWKKGPLDLSLKVYIPLALVFTAVALIKKTPYLLRSMILFLAPLLIAYSELYNFGLASMGFMFMVLATLFVITFHGMRAGLVAMVWCILSAIGFALAYDQGLIAITEIQQNISNKWTRWITPIFNLIIVLSGANFVVAFLLHRLDRSLQKAVVREALLKSERDSLSRANQMLEQMARTDSVTGLANYQGFRQDLGKLLEKARANQSRVFLTAIEIVELENITHNHGYEFMESLLRELARRIGAHTNDDVYRLDGNRFAYCVEDSLHLEDPAQTIESSVQEIFTTPFLIQGKSIHLNFRGGLCIGPNEGHTPEALIRNALTIINVDNDRALNRIAYYHEEGFRRAQRRNSIAECIPLGLERGEFQVYLQPRLDVNNGQILGAELLLRWKSAELGEVSPNEFIPIAESSRQIRPLTEFVLKECLPIQQSLLKSGYADIKFSVNISPALIKGRFLLDLLEKTGVLRMADQLELEFTEGLFLGAHSFTHNLIRTLQELGIAIAIDDFGTGYSNIEYLQDYALDVLKIDRRFMLETPENESHAALVHAVLGIADALGIHAVAEGVEKPEQLNWLRNLGCQEIQGFLVARPMPLIELLDFLKWHRSEIWQTGNRLLMDHPGN